MKTEYQNIQDLFTQTATKMSDKTAVIYADTSITYGEIEDDSNKLANFLVSKKIKKGSIVTILSKNTIEIIIGILGILKAGCVFNPLDTNLPDKRLFNIINEISPEWFILDSQYLSKFGKLDKIENMERKILCTDSDQSISHNGNILNITKEYNEYCNFKRPNVSMEPDEMCYLYYTSGSSGQPKGIAGRLKSIAHFIHWEIKTFNISEGTRISQLISPSFDAFLRDIFVPLCSGGIVCIPDNEDIILDANQLIQWIDKYEVNLIHCVPSLFRTLLSENLKSNQFNSLKYILLSGEKVLPVDVNKWLDIFNERIQLVNFYGPTETTMIKFCYFIKPTDKDRAFIPIGKPIDDTTAIIIGEKGNVCSTDMIGEIFIRTPYRTLGYYRQKELTQKVFIKNPFGNDINDIVYKTGDLARLLPDGNLEFIGRKDTQVKIRGNRIEITEIENILRFHDNVKDVAIVDYDDQNGNKYLSAYLMLRDESLKQQFRDYLLDYFPEYMIPSVFEVMKDFPKTSSGKVDRNAFPLPEFKSLKKEYVPPGTKTESLLSDIWSKILGIEKIGIHNNFFEIGGHSLLATRIISRIRAAFNLELSVRYIFELPTISELAIQIDKNIKDIEKQKEIIRNKLKERIDEMSPEEIRDLLHKKQNISTYPN